MKRRFFQLCVFTVVFGQMSQDLKIQHLSKQESLFVFTVTNQHHLDFENIVNQQTLFSRSLLENIHAKAGSKQTYVSVTQGRLHHLLLKNAIEAPVHGIRIISNGQIQKELLIGQLSDIFSFVRYNMLNEQDYQMNFNATQSLTFNTLGYEEGINFSTTQDIFYAQDPTDVLCIDSIQKLKELLGCEGNKGILSLIDQNSIFQSSYLSTQGLFEYDELTKIAKQKIVIISQIHTSEIEKIFYGDTIKSCPFYNEATIQNLGRETTYNFQKAQVFPLSSLQRQEGDKIIEIPKSKLINQQSYISGEWYAFSSHYTLWVQPLTKGSITIQVQFSNNFIPLYSTLEILITDEQNNKIERKVQNTLEFNEHYKRIKIESHLEQNEYIMIKIKFHKRMKTFEEYPHDPQRGHDIISFPIMFQPDLNKLTYLYFSENHVLQLPAPDFSMPFNILTYTCLTLGYYFLQVLRLSVDRFELNKKEKGSLIQRLIKYIWSLIRS